MTVDAIAPDIVGYPGLTGVGVGGLSLPAAQAEPAELSGERARAALARWDGTASPATFPFTEILAHYQARSRTDADPGLIADLRAVSGEVGPPMPEATDDVRTLAHWLPMTIDQLTGNYDSYFGALLFESLVGDRTGITADVTTDTIITAALAELVRTEAYALLAVPGDRRQQQRTQVAVRALAQVRKLAPRGIHDMTALHEAGRYLLHDDPVRLATGGLQAGGAVLARVPARVRHAAAVTLVPATRVHDEHMFIRLIQIFEGLYQQVVRNMLRANIALGADDTEQACRELNDASSRLAATPLLYRVLTTMPRESFAVIRGHTHGRSAVQSRSYRLVEALSAVRDLPPEASPIGPIPQPGTPLQDTLLDRRHRHSAAETARVTTAMLRLDEVWRTMKRTHWGITLKIIGKVQGTGGTAGADYLKTTAEMPLFPALIGPDTPAN